MRLATGSLWLILLPSLVQGQIPSSSAREFSPADLIQDAIQLVSDSAIASDVRHLESYGSRYAQFSHMRDVALWIRQRFIEAGVVDVDTVGFEEQTHYTWQHNVVATIPGTSSGNEELIIGAHYDSQNRANIFLAPGADDNASGTAGIIEMARVLKEINYQPRATIRFVAFAAEELGLYGSYDYADKAFLAGANIILMQNYDMIGYRDTSQADRNVAINEYQAAITEADLMYSLMQSYTTLTPHKTTANITRSDSWPFALRFFKAVFVIEDENDFNPFYHSARDSSTYLDFSYAKEIIQAGVALTLTIDGQITDVGEKNRPEEIVWELGQNYPNPFNPSTEISFRLPASGNVRLWVHTLLGENVAELVNGPKIAGTHTVRWLPQVSSGTYYYTLEVRSPNGGTEVFRETRRMLLIR